LSALLLAVCLRPPRLFAQVAQRTYEVYLRSQAAAKSAAKNLDGVTSAGQVLQVEVDGRSNPKRLLVRGRGGQLPPWTILKPKFDEYGPFEWVQLRATASFFELRFDGEAEATQAVRLFNGTEFLGQTIAVEQESYTSPRVWVYGLPESVGIAELKAHFKASGTVKYCGPHNHNAEVRFSEAADAEQAVRKLHGSELFGYALSVAPHPKTADGTKVLVWGAGAGVEWQDLKDHFQQVGEVAFVRLSKKCG